jgi:hypothetical protein
MTQEIETAKNKIDALIRKLPIPSYEINVFGVVNVNIHVTCEGFETAEKWRSALKQFCTSVKVVDHVIYNKVNMGTNLLPSRRMGYLIGAVV